MPRSVRDVRGGRWLHPSVAERLAGAIVAAVERGLAIPESELPEGAPRPDSDPFRTAQVEFLSSYVRSVAQELGVGSGTLASREGLLDLVATPPSNAEEIRRRSAFSGWRGQILAESLDRLLARRAALALAPTSEGRARGALVLVPME
jgi:ribonuclease D